jgi:hypothetical protein
MSNFTDNTFHSFAHGLVESKIWLSKELESHLSGINNIWILGSWIGNMGFIIYCRGRIKFNYMINVELNAPDLNASEQLLNGINHKDKLISICEDANKVKFDLPGTNLVINTSTENITGMDWFANIPKHSYVALQGRTPYAEDCVVEMPNLESFIDRYPLTETKYIGQKHFDYYNKPDSYIRFMKIGIK